MGRFSKRDLLPLFLLMGIVLCGAVVILYVTEVIDFVLLMSSPG